MGQHKHNPVAIQAKNGELPPKPKGPSKRDVERDLARKVREVTGINGLYSAMGIDPYCGT